MPYNEYLSGTR